jgi:hypothetical protein
MTEDQDSAENTKSGDYGDDLDIIAKVKKCKKESDKHLAEWREEARTCYAFVAGEQWDESDKAKLLEMMRAPVVFNRIAPMVDAVAGYEVANRQAVQYFPRQVGDTGVNEVLTGAADYIRDQCNAEDEESDSFLDTIICGVGCTETLLDYTDDPEGAVLIERRDPLSMRYDPAAKKRNVTDKRWVLHEDWLTREEIEAQWPDKADQIAAAQDWGSVGDEDGQPHDQTLAFLYKRDATGYDQTSNKYRVIHYQWFELQSYVQALDPATGQIAEFSEDQFATLTERLATLGMPPMQSVTKKRKIYKRVFICGDVVLEQSPVPGNAFSFNLITGKRDRNANIWFGIVRAMLDPQRWANKFFSQLLHIINSNAKGGLMVEESATDNLSKLKADWSKADSVVTLNDGAIAGGKIMPKPPASVPPQINDMLSFSISSLRDVSGINLELLGMADRQQAGVLEAQRKQAAMTVLASLFDGLRRYRKDQGRLLVTLITEYMSDGRLVKIVGGDGTEQYIPLLRQPGTVQFDVVVDEAATTVNQKERTFAILMQLLPQLQGMGVPFSPQLLEYTPLPAAMVQKWLEQMQQAQQQPKQPSPQEITAQANLIKAQAGAQKAQMDAQQAQAEIPIQQQELQVRALEANVARLQAMVEGMVAQQQLAMMNPAGVPQIVPGATF